MTETKVSRIDQIAEVLAEKGYDVSHSGNNVLTVRQVESGVAVQAVLEGDILFLSLVCLTVPSSAITPEVMRKMLAGDNGISTSHFQLYEAQTGQVTVTLSNFCKLEGMGSEDEDDILSCVHFLLVDVIEARHLLDGLSREAKA